MAKVVLWDKKDKKYVSFDTEDQAAEARSKQKELNLIDANSPEAISDQMGGSVNAGAAGHMQNPDNPSGPPQSFSDKMRSDPRYIKGAAAALNLAASGATGGFSSIPAGLLSLVGAGAAGYGTDTPSDLAKQGLGLIPGLAAAKLAGKAATTIENPATSKIVQTLIGAGAGAGTKATDDLVNSVNAGKPSISSPSDYATAGGVGGTIGALTAKPQYRPNVKFRNDMNEFLPSGMVMDEAHVPNSLRANIDPASSVEGMASAIRGNMSNKANPEGFTFAPELAQYKVNDRALKVKLAEQQVAKAALAAQGKREQQVFKNALDAVGAGQEPNKDFFTHAGYEQPGQAVAPPSDTQAPPSAQQIKAWQSNLSVNRNVTPEARQRALDLLAEHAPDKVPANLADRVTYKAPPTSAQAPTVAPPGITDEEFANRLSDTLAKKAAGDQVPLPVTPATDPALGGDMAQTRLEMAKNAHEAEMVKASQFLGQSGPPEEKTLPFLLPHGMSDNEAAAMRQFHADPGLGNVTSTQMSQTLADPKTSPETISGLAKMYGQEPVKQGILSNFFYNAVDPKKMDMSAGPKAWQDMNMDAKLGAAFGDTAEGKAGADNFRKWYDTLQKATSEVNDSNAMPMYKKAINASPNGLMVFFATRHHVGDAAALGLGVGASAMKVIPWPNAAQMMIKNPGMIGPFQKWVDGGATGQALTKMPALRLMFEKFVGNGSSDTAFGDQTQP